MGAVLQLLTDPSTTVTTIVGYDHVPRTAPDYVVMAIGGLAVIALALMTLWLAKRHRSTT